ncbi:MAG: hypothetical protein HYU56_03010 [Candidatus Aenigmarchaeota archaeon]|nr:hypothetical protein [Candidatus Aenigmarchaeota archaeon]
MREEDPEILAYQILGLLKDGLKTQNELRNWYSMHLEEHIVVDAALKILMIEGKVTMYDIGTDICYMKR